MLRILIVVLVANSLLGCAMVQDRYASFDEYIVNKENVDVLLDTVFISDLRGATRGFNMEKNVAAAEKIRASIEEGLRNNGFQANFIQVRHGLSYLQKEGVEYVFSDRWKSLGDPVQFPIIANKESPWDSVEMREYLISLVDRAEKEDKLREADKTKRNKIFSNDEGASTGIKEISTPEIIKSLPSGIFLFVQVNGKLKSLSKRVGTSIAVGAITGVLTGGTLIAGAPGDVYELKLVAAEAQSGRVLWSAEWLGEGIKSAQRNTLAAFDYYPTVEGRYLSFKERKERRRLRRYNRSQSEKFKVSNE